MLIDLNADIGEGFEYQELLAHVTSVNIACGGHAGDESSMSKAVQAAAGASLKIGAHPSYPDRTGFGRAEMRLDDAQITDLIQKQVHALDRIARNHGVRLTHVKPHGALYHQSARDLDFARVVARAVRELNLGLSLVGLAGSRSRQGASDQGVAFIGEAFADRRYQSSGALVSRSDPDALITDPKMAAAQALEIALHGRITPIEGGTLAVQAQTLCIHSDTPGAAKLAKAVAEAIGG
jgi:UPF0271 protein